MIAQDAKYVVSKYGTAAVIFAADAEQTNANVLHAVNVLAGHAYVMFLALNVKTHNMKEVRVYVIILIPHTHLPNPMKIIITEQNPTLQAILLARVLTVATLIAGVMRIAKTVIFSSTIVPVIMVLALDPPFVKGVTSNRVDVQKSTRMKKMRMMMTMKMRKLMLNRMVHWRPTVILHAISVEMIHADAI